MIQSRVPTASGGGVAFSDASDGDIRSNEAERADFARRLGIADRWATLEQVHGSQVVEVDAPGEHGQADAGGDRHRERRRRSAQVRAEAARC